MNYFTIPGAPRKLRGEALYKFIKLRTIREFKSVHKAITTKNQSRIFVQPRQVIHALLHHYTPLTLTEIGAQTNGSDHVTVLHSHKVFKNLCDTDKVYRERVNRIKDAVRKVYDGKKQSNGVTIQEFELMTKRDQQRFIKTLEKKGFSGYYTL